MKKRTYKYDFPENRAIASSLRIGDQLLISELTGHSPEYVSIVLSGKRKGYKVITAARDIIQKRRELKEAYQAEPQ